MTSTGSGVGAGVGAVPASRLGLWAPELRAAGDGVEAGGGVAGRTRLRCVPCSRSGS